MDAAFIAGVAEDRGVGVEDVEFVSIGGHGDVRDGDDSDDSKERTAGFIALGTAAGVVVEDVGG